MINKRGFSLIEVIIVVSIIGIILSISIPSYTKWLYKYRIRLAARDISSLLNDVKLRSVKENNDWAVKFNSSANSYTIYSSQGNIQGWNNGDEIVYRNVLLSRLPGDIVMLGPAGEISTPIIVFNSSGSCISSGNIYITGKMNPVYYRISVTMPGSISLKRWTGTLWN